MHCTFNRGTMSSSFTTLYTYPTPFSLISFDSIGGGANAKQRKNALPPRDFAKWSNVWCVFQ